MSKPNLTSDVLNAILKGKSRAPEISKFIFGNVNSVRSALARLESRGLITRTGRGAYAPAQIGESHSSSFSSDEPEADLIAIRHYVSTLHYCNGKQRQWYALTWTDEEVDLEAELVAAINAEAESSCSAARADNGYSQEEFEDLGDPKYPEIEVGML